MMDIPSTISALHIAVGKDVPMRAKETIRAIADLGLEDDWHARQGSKRQVLLMDEETLAAFGLAAGRLRENITTRGIEIKTLKRGTRLRVGSALLEITLPCAPCDFVEDIQPGLRQQMEGQRGMLACVIESGEMRVGDVIAVEKTP